MATAVTISPLWERTLYSGSEVTAGHFGANQLFDRDVSGGLDTYTEGIEALGVTTVRYPGGTIAETLFDLSDPNGTAQRFMPGGTAFDPDGGGPMAATTMGLDDQLAYCAERGLSLTFVMPSIRFAGEARDGQGNRYEAVDTQLVHDFTIDLLEAAAAEGVEIAAIELGNEWYVDSTLFGETLSAVEYGRIASTLSATIQEAIDAFSQANDLPDGWSEPEIVVQVGPGGDAEMVTPTGEKPPPGYDGPLVSATELIFNEFDRDGEQAAVDGVLVHNYLSGDFGAINGYKYGPFDLWDELAGGDDDFDLASRYVTEWNVRNGNEGMYGLAQAGALVSMMAEMLRGDVDHANVWAVQQATSTALTHSTGKEGESWAGLTAAGEVFSLMSESLVGLRVIPITDESDARDVNVFGDDDTIVIFVASTTGSTQDLELDLSGLVPDDAHLWATTVSTDDPDPLSPDLAAKVESQMADELAAGGTLHLELGPYAVTRIVVTIEPVGVTMRGHDQADDLIGSAQGDTILGGLGDDVLEGGAGADLLDGGDGIDRADYGSAASGVRADLMRPSSNAGEGEGDRHVSIENLAGSERADILRGDGGANSIWGRGGADTLAGRGGDDVIRGGDGHDVVCGDEGHDILYGEGGDDIVFGGSGDDRIMGGDGDDLLFGSEGNDTISGGSGIDLLYGGAGSDAFLFEGGGGRMDVVDFETGVDRLVFPDATTRSSFLAEARQVDGDLFYDAPDGTTLVIRGATIPGIVDDLVFA